MNAGDEHRPAGFRRRVRRIAIAFALVGVLMLVTVVAWRPAPGWAEAVHRTLELTFPVLLLAGGALTAYESFLGRWLATELAQIAGPRIVEALLPRQVLEAFLDSIYGPNEANRDVLVGLLGGAGSLPEGGDLTISTHTEVKMELQRISVEQYLLTTSVTYTFRKNVRVDRFLLFATSNGLLRDSISSGCKLPLFELWYFPDPRTYRDAVDDMLTSVRLSIEYLDENGDHHEAAASQLVLREVEYRRWAEYLSFFREDMSELPRQNTRDHLSDLRIFECDLSAIVAADHSVASIERLSVRSTALQRIDDGYCYWQAPYPCYVERVSFAVKELAIDRTDDYRFMIAPFTFRSNTASGRWLSADELPELEARSWLLPGHGVVLLWRAAHDDG